MPRTKQATKKSLLENSEECDSFVRDFERQTAQRIAKFEGEMHLKINNLQTLGDVALSRLPMEIRNLTLGELHARNDHDEADADEESAAESSPPSPVPATVKGKKKTKRTTAASDDGYATESTTRTTHVSRMNSTRDARTSRQPRVSRSSSNTRKSQNAPRVSRSQSRSRSTKPSAQNNRIDLLKPTNSTAASRQFTTPSAKNHAATYSAVTPKVKPNTPLNLLRRPRDGEMVLSMQGSPLLVSSIVQERVANINVPLHNGNVISLLPNAGLRLSHVPDLDPETVEQLMTLRGHLETVLDAK